MKCIFCNEMQHLIVGTLFLYFLAILQNIIFCLGMIGSRCLTECICYKGVLIETNE